MVLVSLGDGGGADRWTVDHGGRRFAVFVIDGEPFVIDALCPHSKGPLIEGTLRAGPTLVCPRHWFRFDLRTGRCANLDRYDLHPYPVREVDGVLHAELPE